MQIRIVSPRHYDLYLSIHSWIYQDIQPVPEMSWDRSLGRVLTIKSEAVPVIINQEQPGESLEVIWPEGIIGTDEMRSKVTHMLSLDVSMDSAFNAVKNNPLLCPILRRVIGVQPYIADTIFEALVKTIIQQQISYKVANMLTKRLVEATVTPIMFEDRELYGFPNSSQIVEFGEDRLRDLGLGYKASYLVGICRKVQNAELNLDELMTLDFDTFVDLLTKIRGIGIWSARVLAIAGLRDFTTFPYSDLGIRNALKELLGLKERPTGQQVEALSDSWGEGGPLVLYLLMCADVLGLLGEQG